jgi:DNA-binding SARP family transcriptional activator
VTSEAHLELKLLGGFEARLQAGAALVLPTQKAQALLAYLALPLGHSHPREKLATLLWGDMQHAQARGNLRNALSRIKRTLPKAARASVRFDGASVSLDPSAVDVDVARLEGLVADGSTDALRQIGALYRGDLLAGLVLAERPFEEWLTAERVRLHELAIQGLSRLFAISSRLAITRRPSRPVFVSSRWTGCRSRCTAPSCRSMRGLGAGRRPCASTSSARIC